MQKPMISFALPYHVLLEQSWERDRKEMHEGPYHTFDTQGRRISTRAAFFRAGYCCGERCEGCPYFNWENIAPWFPPADETVKTTSVPSPGLKDQLVAIGYPNPPDQIPAAIVQDFKQVKTTFHVIEKFLLTYLPLARVTAIKEYRFVVVYQNEGEFENLSNADAVVKMAHALYPRKVQ